MADKPNTVKVSLPDGSTQEYPANIWQEMLELIHTNSDESFSSGPSQLKEAYGSFIASGERVLTSQQSS